MKRDPVKYQARRFEIARMIATGHTIKEIAQVMNLSASAVEYHLKGYYDSVPWMRPTKVNLAHWFISNGWIKPKATHN